MSRAETIKELVRNLSTDGEALAYPDHPLVLDGPSLLTVVDGVLTASFVYTRGSRPASSVAERARVLLTRLAYPAHTVVEAIFENSTMPESVALGLFDSYRVVTARSLSQPDGDDAARTRVASAVERLRGPHFDRFAANQQGAFKDRPEGARASFAQFSLMATPRYKFVDAGPGKLSAYLPEGTRALTVSRIQRVSETFVARDYGLGLGISALTDLAVALHGDYYLEQHLLRARIPFDGERTGIDASKPLRAAQFAGGLVKSEW
jgi:hypothetical protein